MLVTMVTCPSKGHEDTTPSCAVYTTSEADQYRLYCFGCHHSERINKKKLSRLEGSTQNNKRKYKASVTMPDVSYEFTDKMIRWLESRRVAVMTARLYGCRQVVNSHQLFLPCRQVSGQQIGGQIRYCAPRSPLKIKMLPDNTTQVYPEGSVIDYEGGYYTTGNKRGLVGHPVHTIYLVESVIDGLSLLTTHENKRDVCCYALLGTKVTKKNLQDIYALSTKYPEAMFRILFDPDEAGVTARRAIASRLQGYYGTKLEVLEPSAKPYELELEELQALCKTPNKVGLLNNPNTEGGYHV